MRKFHSTLLLLTFIVGLTSNSSLRAADVLSLWLGGSGSWTEPTNWLHAPFLPGVDYPDNDTLTYDAEINGGEVFLPSLVVVQKLQFTGGTLSGVGLTANERVTWSGGTLNPSGPFVALGGMDIMANSTNVSHATGAVTLHGASSISGTGTMAFDGVWNNIGALTLSNDLRFVRATDGTVPDWWNTGVWRKTGGTGVTEFAQGTHFRNIGELDVQSGGMMFSDLGIFSGHIRCASNSFVEFRSPPPFLGFNSFPSNAVFSGPGTIRITNGAELRGSAPLTLSNGVTVQMRGGRLISAMPGSTGSISIQTGVMVEFIGGSSVYGSHLSSGVISNAGAIVFRDQAEYYDGNLDGLVFNDGLIDFRSDFEFGYFFGGARLVNRGLLQKSGGTGTTYMASSSGANWLLNHGRVRSESGTLLLNQGVTNYGVFEAATNSEIILNSPIDYSNFSPTAELFEGTRFTGEGTNLLSSRVTLRGTGTNEGIMWLGDEYDFRIAGLYGTGVLRNTSGTIFAGSGYCYANARIANDGLMVHRGNFSPNLENAGLYQLERGIIGSQYYYVTPLVNNMGVTRKITSGNWECGALTVFNNSGLFDLLEGTVNWRGSGSHSGEFTVAAGKTLTFTGGTNHFLAGSKLTGAGSILLTYSNVTPTHWSIDGNVTNQVPLQLDAGTISGPGNLVMGDGTTFVWSGGEMQGPGDFIVPETASAQIRGEGALNRRFINRGFVLLTNTSLHGSGLLENYGMVRVANLYSYLDWGLGQIVTLPLANHGTLIVPTNCWLTAAAFTNTGSVRFERGAHFQSSQPYRQIAGETILDELPNNSGSFVVLGGTFAASGVIGGTLAVTNAALDIGSPIGLLNTGIPLLASNAAINFDIGGTQPGVTHDQISVGFGSLVPSNFVAMIQVRLTNGFVPQIGDEFVILTGALYYHPQFRFRGLSVGNGIRLAPRRLSTQLSLVAVPAPTPGQQPLRISFPTPYWVDVSWPPEYQGFQMFHATNVAGPWVARDSYTSDGYTGPTGYFRYSRPPEPHLFFRLVDLEEQ